MRSGEKLVGWRMESDGGREAIRPATGEEEAVKRNTDCVYFLASPLTCKKGNECEYRHSEGARINPRDCRYWLNGNCLNPKCSFRHPPLDSWFATPIPTSGPLPPPQTAASTQIPAARAPPSIINKQNVPCYYFQRGQCLKGERCPFLHGPQAFGSSVSQQVATASTCIAEPPQPCKKNTQQSITMHQNVTELNLDKPKATIDTPVEMPPAKVKLVTKAGNAPYDESSENKVFPPYSLDDEPLSIPQNYVPTSSSYSLSETWSHQGQHSDEQPENGRDTDEFLREYSPGFDVLVEDKIKDPDYFHNEDNLRRVSAHGGQDLEPDDDYDYDHRDYKPMTEFERGQWNGVDKFDNYEQTHSTYGWEPNTFDMILDKPSSLARRVLDRETKLDEMDDTDLRHRLLKQRRLNGSRSNDSPDGHGEHRQRDDCSQDRCSQDRRQISPMNSISTRLQGRIIFPGRFSTDTASNLHLEKERGRRPRGKQSPMRQTDYQGRHPERIRQQSSEDFSKDASSIRNKPIRRDDTNSLDFASPKSLAELKGTKINENFHKQSIKSTSAMLNRLMSGNVEGLRESENSLSFEGPKLLSVILKRRESTYTDSEISAGRYENNQGGGEPAVSDSVPATVLSLQPFPPSEAGKETNHTIDSHGVHKLRAVEEEGMIPTEYEKLTYNGQSSTKADAVEIEDGTDLENVEDDELENYDQRDGDVDYQMAKFKAEDDRNTFPVDEDEIDDEDDFARKVSFMLS